MNTSQEDLHTMRSSYFPMRSEYFTSDLDATRRCKKRWRMAWRKTTQCEDTLQGTKRLEEPPSMGSRRIASHVVLTWVELISTPQKISTRYEETASHRKRALPKESQRYAKFLFPNVKWIPHKWPHRDRTRDFTPQVMATRRVTPLKQFGWSCMFFS